MRIEVGYGLEERLTDARSRHILDNIVRPHFRDGNFGAGIQAGVDAIVATIEGAAPPRASPGQVEPVRLDRGASSSSRGSSLLVIGTFSLVALVAPGGVGWFLYLFLVPFYAAFPTAMFPPYGGIVAAGAWLILFPIVRTLLHTPAGQGVPQATRMDGDSERRRGRRPLAERRRLLGWGRGRRRLLGRGRQLRRRRRLE